MTEPSPYRPPVAESDNANGAGPGVGKALFRFILFVWILVMVLIWMADGLNILVPNRLGKSLQLGSLAVTVLLVVGVFYYGVFGSSKRYIVVAAVLALEFLAFSAIGNHTR